MTNKIFRFNEYSKYAVLNGIFMEGRKAIDLWNFGYGREIYVSNNMKDIRKYLRNYKILNKK